jgi:hypothetical protein
MINQTNNPIQTITNRMDESLLISDKDIKLYCDVSANIQSSSFTPSIILAQDLKILPEIGETLYNELLNEWIAANRIVNNLPDGSLSANTFNYRELYKRILKPLVWWAYTNSIAGMSIKVEEKGVMLNKADYADNSLFTGIREAETRARKNAEYYIEQLRCYIKDVISKRIDAEEIKTEPKKVAGFFGGIYFRSDESCGCNDSCNK